MSNFTDLSLSAIGGALIGFGVSFFDGDFYKGLLLVGVGLLTIVGAAILKKHGYPVSKGKKK